MNSAWFVALLTPSGVGIFRNVKFNSILIAHMWRGDSCVDQMSRCLGFIQGVPFIIITRNAGAAGPLVLESGGCIFLFYFFYHQFFFPIKQFFNFTKIFTTNVYHIFYHKFYHKLLPLTTIIIGVSISTTTPIFVPIRQFLNFTTHFTTHVTTIFTTNHYHYLHSPPHNIFCT